MLRNKTLYFCLTNQLIDRKFIFESVPIVKLPKWKFDISETRSIVYSKGLYSAVREMDFTTNMESKWQFVTCLELHKNISEQNWKTVSTLQAKKWQIVQ